MTTEVELHNRYGLKVDGQLGAEHLTDIAHAVRDKSEDLAEAADIGLQIYTSGTTNPELNTKLGNIIAKNPEAFGFDHVPSKTEIEAKIVSR